MQFLDGSVMDLWDWFCSDAKEHMEYDLFSIGYFYMGRRFL